LFYGCHIEDLSKVIKRKLNAEIVTAEGGHGFLKGVFFSTANTDLIIVDLGVDFEFGCFNKGGELFGFLFGETLFNDDILFDIATKCRVDLLIVEELKADITLHQFAFEDIDDIAKLHVVIGQQVNGFIGTLDLADAALEIKTSGDLFHAHINGIIELRQIDLGYNVKRKISHWVIITRVRDKFY